LSFCCSSPSVSYSVFVTGLLPASSTVSAGESVPGVQAWVGHFPLPAVRLPPAFPSQCSRRPFSRSSFFYCFTTVRRSTVTPMYMEDKGIFTQFYSLFWQVPTV